MTDDNFEDYMEVDHIIGQLKTCLSDILRDRPVLLAYVFGSVAAGHPTPLSDIDIAKDKMNACLSGLRNFRSFAPFPVNTSHHRP